MRKLGTISAPGKLVLCGEYAVLDGAIASVCAIQRRAHLQWGAAGGESTPEVAACLDIAARQQMVPSSFQIDIREFKNKDQKLGLGASGASAACAAAAVVATHSDESDLGKYCDQIMSFALQAHQSVSARGSGIDVAASVMGGVLEYQRNNGQPSCRTLREKLLIPMLVVWTGSSANTSDLIQRVEEARKSKADRLVPLMQQMTDMSSAFIAPLEDKNFSEIATIAGDYGKLLQELGNLADAPIWTSSMTSIDEIVRDHKGRVKPSGAGGGDIVLAFFTEFNAATACFASLSRAGFYCIAAALGGPGVRFD